MKINHVTINHVTIAKVDYGRLPIGINNKEGLAVRGPLHPLPIWPPQFDG